MEKSTSKGIITDETLAEVEKFAEADRIDAEAKAANDWMLNLSKRGEEWLEFATEVGHHIETYTVPQYGDMPDDQMTTASIADIKHNIMRYMNRLGSNARGERESILDLIKVAHYACIAANKLRKAHDVS